MASDKDLERFILWRECISTESWEKARESYLTSLITMLESAYHKVSGARMAEGQEDQVQLIESPLAS